MPVRIAVVGLGKIARDQHLPVIAASPAFELVAGVTPSSTLDGVPCFRSLDEYLATRPAAEAIAMCQPPQVRAAATLQALAAGRHVLLEKPPAASLSEVEALIAAATRARVTLFAAWHSRFAAAVAPARAWLSGRRVTAAAISWKEDVRRWHPGQQWIWEPGGLGVFDPGINALSIATSILPEPLRLEDAVLEVPENRAQPIAATLAMRSGDAAVQAVFDWRQEGPQSWDIRVDTDSGRIDLADGGARWMIDGVEQPVGQESEYAALYRHFADLVVTGTSDVDAAPLRLVADAFMRGRTDRVSAFHD